MSSDVSPHGENLRRAIRWLSEQGQHDLAAIGDAATRFDLTPLEEQFLIDYFRTESPQRGD